MTPLANNNPGTPIPPYHELSVVFRPPALGPAFRELFTVPPNVRLEFGPYCPLDDIVLTSTVSPAGLACLQCRAAWAVDGRNGWWLDGPARPIRKAPGRALTLIAGAILAGSGAAYTAGQEYTAGLPVPEWLIWVTSAGAFAGVGLGVARQWILRRRDQRGVLMAEPIANEDLDPEALALLTRIRDERRARGERVV